MSEETLESVNAELKRQRKCTKNLGDIYQKYLNLYLGAQNEVAHLTKQVSERQFIINHLQEDVAILKQYIGDLRYFAPKTEV
jgi:septation ring formation regulator EzrA